MTAKRASMVPFYQRANGGPPRVVLTYRHVVLTFSLMMLLLNLWHMLTTRGGAHVDSANDTAGGDGGDGRFAKQRMHNRQLDVVGGLHIASALLENEDVAYADALILQLHAKQHVGAEAANDDHQQSASGHQHHDDDDDHHRSGDAQIRKAAMLSIFVSVVSYRDALCPYTLRSLFAQALNPGTVYVGVVEQHSTRRGDALCVQRPSWQRAAFETADSDGNGTMELVHPHLKVMHVPPEHSKGPVYARYLASLMYSGEAFFLMIDSHSLMTLHWDAQLVHMYLTLAVASTAPSGPVISHHPPPWTRSTSRDDPEAIPLLKDDGPPGSSADATANTDKMPFVCLAKFDYPELGYPVLYSTLRKATTAPRPQPFVGAGLVFTRGAVVRDVPFDPYLEYLFHGEEVLLSARLWTSGYDVYAPHRTVLRHYYYRRDSPKFNNDSATMDADGGASEVRREAALNRSVLRVQYFLKATIYKPPWERHGAPLALYAPEDSTPADVKIDSDVYGMGVERSIEAFWVHTGVDIDERKQDERQWCCYPECRD